MRCVLLGVPVVGAGAEADAGLATLDGEADVESSKKRPVLDGVPGCCKLRTLAVLELRGEERDGEWRVGVDL